MHLIATRPGELAVTMTFPTAGRYVINTEFRRQGQMADVHDRQVLTVAGEGPAPQPLVVGPRDVTLDGVHVQLTGQLRAGATGDLTFRFTDGATGAPIHELQPYPAAAGHVVIMRGDAQTFAHEHADVRDADGAPVFALPGQTFGPDLTVHVHVDSPGLYRLWGQFRLADGSLLTVPFTVQAR